MINYEAAVTSTNGDTPSETPLDRLFENSLKNAIYQMNAIRPIPQEQVDDFLQDISELIHLKDTPDCYFGFIGSGSFKECYYSGMDGWVVKFASTENQTNDEMTILKAAADYGVSEMFLPTFFVKLPVVLPSLFLEIGSYVEDSYSDTPRTPVPSSEEEIGLNYLIFQPKAITYYQYLSDLNELHTEDSPTLTLNSGEIAPSIIGDLLGLENRWMQLIVDDFGDKFFRNFIRFALVYDLQDLRCSNIGLWRVKLDLCPTIMDWLSRNPSPNYEKELRSTNRTEVISIIKWLGGLTIE